jgi:hypothetical protein
VGAAVATLLSSAPAGSVVRAAVFGARAEAVIEGPIAVEDAPLVPFARAAMRELGASTRLESAWPFVRAWLGDGSRSRERLVVIVGDGNVVASAELRAAVAEARRAGIAISVLDLADRPASDALVETARTTGGIVVEAGAAAELAARGRDTARLEEAVAPVFAPVVSRDVVVRAGGRRISLGPLRAGEEKVWLGAVPRRAGASIVAAGARARAIPADTATSAALAAAVSQRVAPAANDGDAAAEGRGVPAAIVLGMLRQRVVPAARQCFRRDRAGRADYGVRATFELRLADREVIDTSVTGDIDAALRRCLLDSVHELDVPRFSGTVVVRYPLYTARELPPPVIELEPDVAREVDRILP